MDRPVSGLFAVQVVYALGGNFELRKEPTMTEPLELEAAAPVTELSKGQRRVLGTLLEKAFTTPEVYPLTVKALTAGCNQKSNRHPMTEYSEDDVLEILDELRQLGLVAVIHTETGRTERYRHYVRKRFTWSEPQLAVMTELLLRGRQTVGDLRARASRMVPIENLDDLRAALRGLMDQKFVQATGALERRGVEVDHHFYQPGENKKLAWDSSPESEADEATESRPTSGVAATHHQASVPRASSGEGSPALQTALRQLQDEHRELSGRLETMESEVQRLKAIVDDLVRDLRG